jgi:uncharacterized membrane protein YhfC
MVLVAVLFLVGWKVGSQTQWRWFWAGAAIWTVGVALKFACALLLNTPVLAGLKSLLPHPGYVGLGALYIGLLTGIFEIGVTLAAGRKWPSLARDANRAVAVGVGAGAFEAILLGFASLAGVLVAMSNLPGSEQMRQGLAAATATTPFVWLAGWVERTIAILCHTSSRTLVLFSVAKRRGAFFWYGFLLMTLLDGVAGFAYLSGAVTSISLWWIELAIAPFALASVLIIGWCLRHWPSPTQTGGEAHGDVLAPSDACEDQ